MSELLQRLRRLRVVALHRVHTAIDRRRAAGTGPRDLTAARIELDGLSIDGPNREAGHYHLPAPWTVLDWVQAALPKTKANWSFVDLGAGLGRATLSAGRRPYARVVGVEFAGELAATARAILARAGGLRAASMAILHMDAAKYELPAGPLVIFIFDAFGPPVIDAVARSIERSYQDAPRPIVIAYLHPRYPAVFQALRGFERVALDRRSAFRFRFLSPYRLRLYATAEARAFWR